MAKIRVVKGTTSLTKRNLVDSLPTYLTYANTILLIVLLVKSFIK